MNAPDFIEQSPAGFISTDAVDDHGDIVLIPIAEWKKRHGTPGNGTGLDINGRINGYFPTEPDYCEDAPEVFSSDETNSTEQTREAA
jgi:hypothetical protein